jgi:hypothetical protein
MAHRFGVQYKAAAVVGCEVTVEQQIPCGNDRKKSKDKSKGKSKGHASLFF